MFLGKVRSFKLSRKWLDKLAIECEELRNSTRSNKERFETRQSELEAEFASLRKSAEDRRYQLENAAFLYQYMRESQDLEQWINEQLQVAMSEEYGQDYEHLIVSFNKSTASLKRMTFIRYSSVNNGR